MASIPETMRYPQITIRFRYGESATWEMTLRCILRSKKSLKIRGNNRIDEMIKINPGMTQSSKGMPDKLFIIILFNEKPTNTKSIKGRRSTNSKLGTRRFFHDQIRRISSA